MSPLLASIVLSVLSAVAYAAAALVQERIAATTAPSRWTLLRRRRWWVAVLLNGVGALLHVAALGLGPLTVVQPLGVLTIVIAVPLRAVLLKRPISRTGWQGMVLVSAGLAGVLLFTGAHQSDQLTRTEQYALCGGAAAVVLVLTATALGLRGGRLPGIRSLALATAAGIAFGTASVCVKTVAEGWALDSVAAAVPVLVLITLFAATGLLTAQASYRGRGLAAPLATTTVVNPALAAAVGLTLLNEGFRFGLTGAVTAPVAALVTVWGLVILTRDSAAQGRHTGITSHETVIIHTGARCAKPVTQSVHSAVTTTQTPREAVRRTPGDDDRETTKRRHEAVSARRERTGPSSER